MIKGVKKWLGIVVGCGLLAQGCVSASAYRGLETRYNNEVSMFNQHTKTLQIANQDLKNERDATDIELKRTRLEKEKMEQKGRVDQETMLRLQENVLRKLAIGGIPGVSIEDDKVVIQGDVLFSPGEATLKASAKEILNKIAEPLRDAPEYYIRIDGHTDTDPIVSSRARWTTGSNFELAAYRALSVLLHFEDQGINPARMFLCSFGEHRPKSSAKKSENRRVTISFIEMPAEKSGEKPADSDTPSK